MLIDERRAAANPTKAFFVTMITRDITLEDSILDLVDNSVDAAWKREGGLPANLDAETSLSSYSICININPEYFSIADDCGGMTLEDAANHAFGFGRTRSHTADKYGIGVYGIGMKRAAFKIGRQISIRSTYLDSTESRQSFAVPISADIWIENDAPPWDFDIEEAEHLASNGVEVKVENLTAAARTSFDNPAFLQNFRRNIARDYSLHLHRGLNISINGEPVIGLPIELRESEEYAPLRVKYVDSTEDENVNVEVIGGMAAPPPEDMVADESLEGDKRFGWYVICNGRIVLAADKSATAGWGTGDWPQWHSQYSGFMGIVLFTAANAKYLPLTTTKRGVDVTSEVFLRARQRMRDVSKHWIAYTNNRKLALDAAKTKERSARSVPIFDVKTRDQVVLPKLTAVPKERVANVHYTVPLVRMKNLARELGSIRMAYRDVGLKSFSYTYDDLVGEE